MKDHDVGPKHAPALAFPGAPPAPSVTKRHWVTPKVIPPSIEFRDVNKSIVPTSIEGHHNNSFINGPS
jgi:hypothetical protein